MTLQTRVVRLERINRRRAGVPCVHCGGEAEPEFMLPPGQPLPEPWCPRRGKAAAWKVVAMPDDALELMGLKR